MPKVRVVLEDGEQLGILDTHDALRRAEDLGLDLVEVSPRARPPVCKIMDFGKFKYQQKRNAAAAKKSQQQTEVKEVKFRPKTDRHDFDVKVNRVDKFLRAGNKCKVTIMFRGREIVHPDIGRNILTRVAASMEEIAQIEFNARMEGRQMFMILAPRSRKGKTAPHAPKAPPLKKSAPKQEGPIVERI